MGTEREGKEVAWKVFDDCVYYLQLVFLALLGENIKGSLIYSPEVH